LGTIAHLLLFAILGFVPLVLLLAAPSERNREGQHWLAYRAALLLQPVAALLVLLSYWLPTGLPAALLTSPWLLGAGGTFWGGALSFAHKQATNGGIMS
jgi:hypothetical protein